MKISCNVAGVACSVVLTVLLPGGVSSRGQGQETFASGKNIAPVYEGWEKNPDGSFNLVFGYFNRNWEEELDIAIGPNNTFEPGASDRGQPTHFYSRRSRFVFRVRVPADFGKSELIWSLTANGKTERAYATLLPEYFIDKLVISANNGGGGAAGGDDPDLHRNEPPSLRVDGEATRTAKVGVPVSLVATAHDDGIPKPRAMPPAIPGVTTFSPDSATGLRVLWFVYRGAGAITFAPQQILPWEDIRNGANSPTAPGWRTPPPPPNNQWIVHVTFGTPGAYVLRCQAHDGALAVVKDVTFVVSP